MLHYRSARFPGVQWTQVETYIYMDLNGHISTQIDTNGHKCTQIDTNGHKWTQPSVIVRVRFNTKILLAMLIALHSTPLSHLVGGWVDRVLDYRYFEACELVFRISPRGVLFVNHIVTRRTVYTLCMMWLCLTQQSVYRCLYHYMIMHIHVWTCMCVGILVRRLCSRRKLL